MSFFKVDASKCVKDNICIETCPIGIIKSGSLSGLPELVEWGPKACINCGHCVAVCPKGAISLQSMPAGSCRELANDWRISPEKMEQFLKGRRSIRRFKEKRVDPDIIAKLIDVARYAPSGINRQPVNWAVIDGKDRVAGLAGLTVEWMRGLIKDKSPLAESLRMENLVSAWDDGLDRIARNAPAAIITYALKEDTIAPPACVAALTYMELFAVSMGLGACLAGYIHMAVNNSPEVRRYAGLSQRTCSHGAMLIGYQKYEFKRIPLRNDPHIIQR